jgi:hypothetical protein
MPVKSNHGMSEMKAAITNPLLTGDYYDGPSSDPGGLMDTVRELQEAQELWEISLYERDYNVQMQYETFNEGVLGMTWTG